MDSNINEVKNVINQLVLINDVIQNIITSNTLRISTAYKNYDNIVLRLLAETSKLRSKVELLDVKVLHCAVISDDEMIPITEKRPNKNN